MSNLICVRTKSLNKAGLTSAEKHGRRLDKNAIARKVRDEPSLTWVPEGVAGDPLALHDRLQDHLGHKDETFVPKSKTSALQMLVKLPDSVPVATEEEARAALQLAVDFAQETYGGEAVFAARMDRDERSLNNVDLFLAPKYLKQRKAGAVTAISFTRHTKLLVEKHKIEVTEKGAYGSMKAQGSALQTEFAQWLRARGFEAERGTPKVTRGDDWKIPEVVGAAKDREQAAKDRELMEAARQDIREVVSEQLPSAKKEAAKIREVAEADAKAVRDAAEADAQAVREEARKQGLADAKAEADQIRKEANADAAKIRQSSINGHLERMAEADRRKADLDRREDGLTGREQAVGELEEALSGRETAVGDRETAVKEKEAAAAELGRQRTELAKAEAKVRSDQLKLEVKHRRLEELLKQLEPVLKPLRDLTDRVQGHLQTAPAAVRAWLGDSELVKEAVQTVKKLNPLLEQALKARAAAREAGVTPVKAVGPASAQAEEEEGVSVEVQQQYIAKGGKWRG